MNRILSVTAIVLATALGSTGCSTISGLIDKPAAPPPASSTPSAEPGVVSTDPVSGVSARLAGPAKVKNGKMSDGVGALRSYPAQLPNRGVQLLSIGEVAGGPKGDPASHAKEIATSKQGTLTSNKPVTVNGHPGTDFRMNLALDGKKGFMLGRIVFTPTGLVQLYTIGAVADEVVDKPLHDQAVASLKVP